MTRHENIETRELALNTSTDQSEKNKCSLSLSDIMYKLLLRFCKISFLILTKFWFFVTDRYPRSFVFSLKQMHQVFFIFASSTQS